MNALTHALYTVEALCGLLFYDVVALLGFSRTHTLLRRCPTFDRRPDDAATAHIVAAVAEACVWYVKRVQCLQRSAVATWLLRIHGVPAELVVGFRQVPLQSHAWVEVHGQVVNDRPQYQRFFMVLERL